MAVLLASSRCTQVVLPDAGPFGRTRGRTSPARLPRTRVAESHNLAGLAEGSLARLGDHDALVFEGAHRSAALHERAARRGWPRRPRCAAGGPGRRADGQLPRGAGHVQRDLAGRRRGHPCRVPRRRAAELAPHPRRLRRRRGGDHPELLPTVLVGVACRTDVRLRHIVVAGRCAGGRAGPARGTSASWRGEARAHVSRGRRRPGRAHVHGRHHRAGQGRGAQPRQLWRTGRERVGEHHVPGANRVITPLPLSHAYGMIVTIVGMHVDEPGLAVIQRWFNAAEWIALSEQHGLPAHRARARDGADAPRRATRGCATRLARATSAAAPRRSHSTCLREFERRVPSAEILEGYGCTETSAVISSSPPGRRRAAVGLPIQTMVRRSSFMHDDRRCRLVRTGKNSARRARAS